MKLTLIVAAALAAGSVLVGAGQAAAAKGQAAPTPVMVVMHDPGCHWFSVNGKFTRTLAVKGPAVLSNRDEATLDIVGGQFGMRAAPIGKHVVLARGIYRIVMVGQARDDNVLTLLVK